MSRRRRSVLGALLAMCAVSAGVFGQALADDAVVGKGKGDQRSQGREVADFVAQHGLAVEPGREGPASEKSSSPGTGNRALGNTQVNDSALDNIQTFTGTRPFEKSTQSETSIA